MLFSGDDLITPVYIPPTPRPYPRTTPSISGGGGTYVHGRSSAPPRHAVGLEDTTCDDEEDCVEGGSGLGEVAFTSNQNTPATPTFVTTSDSHGDSSEPFVSPPRFLPPPTHEIDVVHRVVITPPSISSTELTPYRRPPPEEVVVVKPRPPPPPIYPIIPQQTPRPPHRTSSRAPPSVYGVPIPDMPVTGRERNKPPPKVKTSSAADNTAMVIGIIAGVLIVVVIVALVVYRVRSWTLAASPGAGGYKVEEAQKRYHFPPAAGTAPYQSQPVQHMNGAPAQNKPVKNPRKKEVVKDLKEWYV